MAFKLRSLESGGFENEFRRFALTQSSVQVSGLGCSYWVKRGKSVPRGPYGVILCNPVCNV
jgi:hypothetical protein